MAFRQAINYLGIVDNKMVLFALDAIYLVRVVFPDWNKELFYVVGGSLID